MLVGKVTLSFHSLYLLQVCKLQYKSVLQVSASGAGSRPVSGATTASAELGGYGAALEDVLAWLLEAEERLAAQPPLPAAGTGDAASGDSPAGDTAHLHALKEQFHTHEVRY